MDINLGIDRHFLDNADQAKKRAVEIE